MTPGIPELNLEQAKKSLEALSAAFEPQTETIPVNTEMAIVFEPEAAE